jgi:uncharacterized protein YcnI
MLHAYSITLDIPGDDEGKTATTVTADIPEDMKEVLKNLLLI